MAVRIKSHIDSWAGATLSDFDLSVLDMATDIHRVSGMLAPKDTRALVNSGKIERKGFAHYRVRYGNSTVPYAKRRHFENEKTPSSLLYLERAGEQAHNPKRYFKSR